MPQLSKGTTCSCENIAVKPAKSCAPSSATSPGRCARTTSNAASASSTRKSSEPDATCTQKRSVPRFGGECGGRAPEEPCTAQRPRRVRRERVEVLAVEAQTVVVGEPLARHEHARDEAGEEGGLRVDELPSRVHCSKSSRITPYITPSVHSPCRRYALRLTPSLIHPARSACRCARSLKPYTIISSR